MPRRDPETGKFVSGSDIPNWDQLAKIGGTITSTIPAADLGGGTVGQAVQGDATEVVNMSEILRHEQVFEAHYAYGVAVFAMPTTATAEGSAQAEYAISTDHEQATNFVLTSSFYSGSPSEEEGVADIETAQESEQNVLHASRLIATPSFGDSVNGLGAGSDHDRERWDRDFLWAEQGPTFDQDDELYIPHHLHVDGVSDHAVDLHVSVQLEGEIHDLDD